jgi:mRNA interferase RelE/StbE
MRKLLIPDDVADLLRGLHPDLKRKTRAALRSITADPGTGKSLKDDLEGLKSCRVGRFRIVYRVSSGKRIEIVAVGPRKCIYEETLRILKKESRRT